MKNLSGSILLGMGFIILNGTSSLAGKQHQHTTKARRGLPNHTSQSQCTKVIEQVEEAEVHFAIPHQTNIRKRKRAQTSCILSNEPAESMITDPSQSMASLMSKTSQAISLAHPSDESADSDKTFCPISGLNNGFGKHGVIANVCFANALHKALTQIPGFIDFLKPKLKSGEESSLTLSELEVSRIELRSALFQLLVELRRRSHLTSEERSAEPKISGDPFLEQESEQLFTAFKHFLSIQNQLYTGTNDSYFDHVGTRRRYIGRDQLDAEEYARRLLDAVEYSNAPEGIKVQNFLALANGDRRSGPIEREKILPLCIDDESITDISSALAFYQRTEHIEDKNDFILSNHHHNGTYSSSQLHELPRYSFTKSLHFILNEQDKSAGLLMMSLKRIRRHPSSGASTKITKSIAIDPSNPIEIDFYSESDATFSNKLKRKLYPTAILVHRTGTSTESGHYVAYIKDRHHNKWTLHNDTRVQTVDIHRHLEGKNGINQNAYLMIYLILDTTSGASNSLH